MGPPRATPNLRRCQVVRSSTAIAVRSSLFGPFSPQTMAFEETDETICILANTESADR